MVGDPKPTIADAASVPYCRDGQYMSHRADPEYADTWAVHELAAHLAAGSAELADLETVTLRAAGAPDIAVRGGPTTTVGIAGWLCHGEQARHATRGSKLENPSNTMRRYT